MDNDKHEEFRRLFEEREARGPEPIDLGADTMHESVEELEDLDLEYDEVLVDTEDGSFLYDPESNELEELNDDTAYLGKLVMEYNDEWMDVDMDRAVPGAEAYMFKI